MKELVKYDSSSLEKLMKVSAKLAKLTEERNEKWNTSLESAKQALLAFRGEVFRRNGFLEVLQMQNYFMQMIILEFYPAYTEF